MSCYDMRLAAENNVLWLSVEHNVLLGSLWLLCLLGFLFAIVCTAIAISM